MDRYLSSNFYHLADKKEPAPFKFPNPIEGRDLLQTLPTRFEKGGLIQLSSHKGGSKTWFALTCLSLFLEKHHGDPPLSSWVSDEGMLYPDLLSQYWKIPLSRMLLIRTPTSQEVWKVGLESVQTGLFAWLFLRTSRGCHSHFLRKIQLAAEKTKTRVLLLSEAELPHWTLKGHYHLSQSFPLPVPTSVLTSLSK